jgi:hypothetical protein
VSFAHVRREPLDIGLGDDPIVYSMRLYVQYLQGLFNFMPAGSFHWEPNDEITEIVIRGQAPLNTEVVGKRPAITVVMGPCQYSGIGIDNMLSFDSKTGNRTRTDLLTGFLVVYTLADSDITALRLAHVVAHHTRVDQRLLESPGGFHAIARPSPTINSPSPPGQLVMGDPGQLVMCQVNIPFQIQWTWQTQPKQQAQFRSLEQITGSRRASDFEYEPTETVSSIRLAMSTEDIRIRRIGGPRFVRRRGGLPEHKPSSEIVHAGIQDFQISGLEAFQDEE